MYNDTLLWLSSILYPKGRAFKMPVGNAKLLIDEDGVEDIVTEDGTTSIIDSTLNGNLARLHAALALSEDQAFQDALSVLNDILPDNNNFTIDDANDWYRRLGIFNSGFVTLSDMKAAISQKMAYPGTVAPRQAHDYLQDQLQAAGFNVFVYENIFSDGHGGFMAVAPSSVVGTGNLKAESDFCQSGQIQSGQTSADNITIIANNIDETKDQPFNFGSNYRSTFFIAGNTISTFATVVAGRHDEFRQLILQIKPQQTIGFLFINYI